MQVCGYYNIQRMCGNTFRAENTLEINKENQPNHKATVHLICCIKPRQLLIMFFTSPDARLLSMSIIKVKDRAGVSLLLRQVGDVRIPPAYSEEVLREVPKLALREDDIILLGWMRSGTHWTYEMICMLINNNTETIRKKKEEDMIEFVPHSTLDNTPSPRVLNTHLLFHQMPEDLKTEKIKVVFLLRDPRDAIVSWHRMQTLLPHYEYKGAWKDWFPLCIYGELDWGSWFDYVRDWERELPKHPNLDVYFWYYEDMKKVQWVVGRKCSRSNSMKNLRMYIDRRWLGRYLKTDTKAQSKCFESPNVALSVHNIIRYL
ncbi:sulfotransferase 1A2-like isoform X2 [Haliotis rufescens]|uniref:sulfotransferase 1A2-like isoform X2 n=1 Tax=Haliotis rufescens TaxID=6454 RepID=UPI00201F15FF|nr:sulfotransferase 1A2-like isoform X2 [Haliotis rufescens]